MPMYKFLHNLLNVLVQIANKTGLQKKSTGLTVILAQPKSRMKICGDS
jgi:hypothetical protein